MQLQQDDILLVQEVVAFDSAVDLHSRQIPGLFEHRSIDIQDKYLFYTLDNQFLVYDLIGDMQKLYDFPTGLEFDYFAYVDTEGVVFYMSPPGTNDYQTYFLDFEEGVRDATMVPWPVHQQFGDYFIRSFHEEGKVWYLLHQWPGNEVDTLIRATDKRHYFVWADDLLFFQDEEGYLCQFDPQTKQKIKFEDYDPLLYDENNLKVMGDSVMVVNSGFGSLTVQLFDRLNKQRIYSKDFASTPRLSQAKFHLFDDKLVGFNYDGPRIVIADLDSGDLVFYESHIQNFEDLILLPSGHIVHYYPWDFYLVDVNDLSQTVLESGGFQEGGIRQYGAAMLDEKILFSTDAYYSPENPGLFVVDPESNTCEVSGLALKTQQGFEEGLKVVELNGELLLLADELFHVQDGQLVQVNDHPLLKFAFFDKFKITNDKLYTLESIEEGFYQNAIYSYDGMTRERIARIPLEFPIFGSIWDFELNDNYVYFVDFEYNLKRVNQQTEEIELLASSISDFLLRGNFFFSHNDHIYFSRNGNLWVITQDSTPVEVEGQGEYFSFATVYTFKDRLFITEANGLFELDGNLLEPWLYDENLDFPFLSFVQSSDGQYAFIKIEDKLYTFDGVQMQVLTVPTGSVRYVRHMTGSIFNVGNYFYDINTGVFSTLPDGVVDWSFLDLFQNKNNTFLITKNGQDPFDPLLIYKVVGDFEEYEWIDEIPDVGKLNAATYFDLGDEGFLYSGDIIFIMDEDLNFIPLSGVKGSALHPEIVEQRFYIYFLGLDTDKGRQLYRIKLISAIEDGIANESMPQLKIFPNPVRSQLCLEEDVKGRSIQVFDAMGHRKAAYFAAENCLDVSHLSFGTYYLMIPATNGKIWMATFEKLN